MGLDVVQKDGVWGVNVTWFSKSAKYRRTVFYEAATNNQEAAEHLSRTLWKFNNLVGSDV